MFPNLKAEMARLNITAKDIADKLERTESWVENRLQGKTGLPVIEAVAIKNHFFPDMTFEYLYSDTAIFPFKEVG
jgi:hypothetical protein